MCCFAYDDLSIHVNLFLYFSYSFLDSFVLILKNSLDDKFFFLRFLLYESVIISPKFSIPHLHLLNKLLQACLIISALTMSNTSCYPASSDVFLNDISIFYIKKNGR